MDNAFRVRLRSAFKQMFHLMLGRLGIRCFREHSFFGTLLPRPAVVADFGAHRGEFFAALKSEYLISRALLVEADPALAESLQQTFRNEADVLHAALVGENRGTTVVFTRSFHPEASSIFSEAVYSLANQFEVPTVDFAEALRRLGGRIDLAKLDIEGAEIEVLQTAHTSDLAACGQLSVELHDKSHQITRRAYKRLRSEGYGVVNANWPFANDMLFVNLRHFAASRRLRFRCRMAVVNTLFVLRGAFFCSIRWIKKIRSKPFEAKIYTGRTGNHLITEREDR